MRFSVYFFIVLSIIALFIDSTYSKGIHLSKKKHINTKKLKHFNKKNNHGKNNKGKNNQKKLVAEDQFYIITVENPYPNNDTTVNTKQKRDLNSIFIDEIVSDINTLIVENKDTYENAEVLDELDEEAAQIKNKRSEQSLNEDNKSNYVKTLSSANKYTMLYAYLSNDLVDVVEEMTNIKGCEPEIQFEAIPSSFSKYQEEVKKDTGWSSPSRNLNTKLHLSLISQGKYDSAFINNYDDSYYFPSSPGSGVDVFIIDVGFNFRSSELGNRGRCYIYVKGGEFYKYENGKDICYTDNANTDEYDNGIRNHGSIIAASIGGNTYGVAPSAKIYGVVIDKKFPFADFVKALKGIQDFSSNKKIIVLSYMLNMTPSQRTASQAKGLDDLINTIAENTVFINSAGNKNSSVITDELHFYPCVLDSVLCIGAIDNNVNDLKTMNTSSYKKLKESNYGKEVNVYGPGCVYVSYQNYYNENTEGKDCGTSYTAGIAGGIAASIISEENKNYSSKSMIQKFNNLGIKNVISGLPSGSNNVLMNNGKHIVYSKYNSYKEFVCGASAGNKKCPSGNCCSKYGYCGTGNDYCGTGCQSQFGICK